MLADHIVIILFDAGFITTLKNLEDLLTTLSQK